MRPPGLAPRARRSHGVATALAAVVLAAVVLAAVVLAAVVLTACGGGGSDGNDAGAPPRTATEAPPTVVATVTERITLVRDRRLLARAPDGAERLLFRADASNVFPAFPAWSPDGARIAFVQSTFAVSADADWGDDIFVIDAHGGDPERVWKHTVHGEQLQGIAWAADGSTLIAGVNTPETGPSGAITGFHAGLLRIDVATGAASTLVDGALEPSLSRDGTRLVYLVPGGPGETALWIADADGSHARAIPLPGNLDPPFAPRVSPDGASISFSAPSTGAFSRRSPVAGMAGRLASALALAPRRAEASEARAAHGVPMEVWRVDVADGTLTPLTDFREDDPRSAWEPDATTLIVIGTGGLYRIPTDGSGPERIDEGAYAGQLDVR